MLRFGRDVCGDYQQASQHEWLVTNGLGGYASGTISGALTRRYHGLLIAALQPPVGRTLMLTKLDETVTYDGAPYPLFANVWSGNVVDAPALKHLEGFQLEGTTPVWTFSCGDALLEKRVWMERDANRTFIAYKLVRALQPMSLSIKALVNYRDHHSASHAGDWQMKVELNSFEHVLTVCAFDGAADLYIKSDSGNINPQHEWYRGFYLS
jgi:predicted glycogen debranching enzyme